MTIHYTRVGPTQYRTICGRATITHQGRWATDVQECWVVVVDGQEVARVPLLREAELVVHEKLGVPRG